jgi:hypothetical protein
MPSAFETSLADTSRRLVNASEFVVSNMAQSQAIENQTLWEIQTEVVWTLMSALMRGIYNLEGAGRETRDAIQDDLMPILVNDMLDSAFDWPPDSEKVRAAEYQGLLIWFDRSESDNRAAVRFMSSQADFFQMMFDGRIPEDSLVGKLCRRVARATGEEGNSELIQALFLQAAEAHVKADIPALTLALVEAQKAS